MSFFKKSKKSLQPSKQPMSLGIPTQIATGALGMSADLDREVGPGGASRSVRSRTDWVDLTIAPGGNNERGSRIVVRDSVQRAAGAFITNRESGDDVTCACVMLRLMGPIPMILNNSA